MNVLKSVFVLFFPIIVFASSSDYYLQSFADSFQEKRFNESLQILNDWELAEPVHRNRILGMKAAVCLAMGCLEESRVLMDEFTQNLKDEEISDPLLSSVMQMYYKAFDVTEELLISNFSTARGKACLCKQDLHKQEQPKGVKLKYWFGVGQIVVGLLAAPFSAGTSTALILSGTATVVDAACDALNNQDNWGKELNERQRMNSSFSLEDECREKLLKKVPYRALY